MFAVKQVRRFLAAGFAAAALAAGASPAAAGDPADRNWCTPDGGSDRARSVDVEPVRNQPRVAWQLGPDLTFLAAPVVWDGAVFVLVRPPEGKVPVLQVHDARTGRKLASTGCLGLEGGDFTLLVWQGMVVVGGPGRTQAYAFRGSGLKREWTEAISVGRTPNVFRGVLFAQSGACDLRNGRPLPQFDDTWCSNAVVTREGPDWVLLGVRQSAHERYVGDWLHLRQSRLSSVDGDPQRVGCQPKFSTGLAVYQVSGAAASASVAAIPGPRGTGVVVFSADPFSVKEGACSVALWHSTLGYGEDGARFVEGVTPVAVSGDGFYVRDPNGTMLSVGLDCKVRRFIEREDYPKDSWTGTPSVAREVVYMGNWAVDTSNLRIVWVHALEKDEKPAGCAIPCGDGLVLLRTDKRRLICLADPLRVPADGAAPTAAAGAAGGTGTGTRPATPAAAAGAPARPDLPGEGDGVYLLDGRWIAGKPVLRDAGAVEVTPPAGAAQRFAAEHVAAALDGATALVRSDETRVFDAVRIAVGRAWAERLLAVFEEAVKLELPGDAQKVLDEARASGLPAARAEELGRRLAGRRGATDPSARQRGLARVRATVEAAGAEEGARAVSWLERCGFRTGAAALADRVGRAIPSWKDADARIAALLPSEFPWKDRQDAAELWRGWAPWLVASGARFLPAGSKEFEGLKGASWQKGAIGLRSPNVLLLSRTGDPAVVGLCLTRAELTVRGLEHLLGGRPPAPAGKPHEPEAPLVVRLLATRAEYIAEAPDSGLEWSNGCFDPRDNVSRFFVPSKDETLVSTERDLFSVLSHELTHAWVWQRWVGYRNFKAFRTPKVPGYWVVEGLATFFEDQIVDVDTRGLRLDDPTVLSVDAASACLRDDLWLDPGALAAVTQIQFHGLDPRPEFRVKLTRSRLELAVSPRNLFYFQSAALVHFLVNQRGEKGREQFLKYLEQHYTGRTSRDPWSDFGFATEEEFVKAFEDWLRTAVR